MSSRINYFLPEYKISVIMAVVSGIFIAFAAIPILAVLGAALDSPMGEAAGLVGLIIMAWGLFWGWLASLSIRYMLSYKCRLPEETPLEWLLIVVTKVLPGVAIFVILWKIFWALVS